MSTLEEITKEKQRIGEALARVDAQRDKLASQLSELEATERVLARYTKGTRAEKMAAAKTPATATKAAAPARPRGRRRATVGKPAGASAARQPWGIRSLPWQPARRSRKSPPPARELARTMSASSSLGTNGLAASKSATGNSTPRSPPRRSNARRSDPGINRASASKVTAGSSGVLSRLDSSAAPV